LGLARVSRFGLLEKFTRRPYRFFYLPKGLPTFIAEGREGANVGKGLEFFATDSCAVDQIVDRFKSEWRIHWQCRLRGDGPIVRTRIAEI
jgi:hypothetical protein